MPDRSRQKERKRLKRKRKQEAHRKVASMSPFKSIARMPAEVQCWMNTNWAITRQASIFVLRQTKSGRCAMVNFLVDFGMAGLKDAYGRLDITASEFFDKVLKPSQNRFPMALIEPDEAGKLIAGGIRFAHDNGFRLPHRYERWLAIFGDIGDWRTADVSDFEMEFAGSFDDLRHRLIGQPVDEFLKREDVSIVLSDGATELLSDDLLDFEEKDEELRERAVSDIRQWLMAAREAPGQLLERAWDIYVEAFGVGSKVDEEADDEVVAEEDAMPGALRMEETIQDLIELEPLADRPGLSDAIMQIIRFAIVNQESMVQLLSIDGD